MSNRDEINEKIYGLKYEPSEVLAFNGNKVDNLKPHDDHFDGETYVVVTREKHSLSQNFDIAVPNAYLPITYPGALVKGNSKLVDGAPQTIASYRAPMNIMIDLPGMATKNRILVDNPTYDNVKASIDTLLNAWYDECGGKYAIPANFQLMNSLVEDEKQMSLRFGCDVSFLTDKLGINFNAIKENKQSVYISQFKQIFYTVAVTDPVKPADVFADNQTWDDLAAKGVDENNPPMYIQSVQYGRQVYLKFESSLEDNELEEIINGSVSKDGVVITPEEQAKYKEKLSKINVTLIALGGNASAFSGIMNEPDIAKKLNTLLFETTDLNAQNPAAPLNYMPAFLQNNATEQILGYTEYIEETSQSYTSGNIYLRHTGAYVAQFFVSWEEVSVNDDGQLITKNCDWSENGDNKTAGFETTIALKGNCRSIHIKAQGNTGLIWDLWHTSGEYYDLPLVPRRSVKISGTTLNQSFTMDPPATLQNMPDIMTEEEAKAARAAAAMA